MIAIVRRLGCWFTPPDRQRVAARSLSVLLTVACQLAASTAQAQPTFNATTGSYYERVTHPCTWVEATIEAESRIYLGRRGRLATVTSSSENQFIRTTFGDVAIDQHWIGLAQREGASEPSGGWTWVTVAEPVGYTNWAPGEPNNFGASDENRAMYWANAGMWNDAVGQADARGYIVEYAPLEGDPFSFATADYLGRAATRGGTMPSAMYQPSDPAAVFKVWSFGGATAVDMMGEPPPHDLDTTDRIYYAFAPSGDGTALSAGQLALKPRGGINGRDNADDHLVGSPSVIRWNGKYYMFYEAYGSWMTAVNRFFSASRGDTWTVHGTPQFALSRGYCNGPPEPDWHASYQFEKCLGFAPKFRKAGTVPIFAGEVTYALSSGPKINRYLSRVSPRTDCGTSERWRVLNGQRHEGSAAPAFWLYDQPAPGRKRLWSAWDAAHQNTFVTDREDGEGVGILVEFLGYVCERIDSPDMVGSLQNRVCMATSDDGVHWTPFDGPARGGAMIAPVLESSSGAGTPNEYPNPCPCPDPRIEGPKPETAEFWDIRRSYGAGYPSATVRDDQLEVYFFDDTGANFPCLWGPNVWRVRLPLTAIENAAAWATAAADRQLIYPSGGALGADVRWSPYFRRYFSAHISLNDPGAKDHCTMGWKRSAMLRWSRLSEDPFTPAEWDLDDSPDGSFDDVLPTNYGNSTTGRWGGWGSILGNELGQALDFPSATVPHSVFHLYYAAADVSACSSFGTHLDHLLIFAYPKDSDLDGIPDWNDWCRSDFDRSGFVDTDDFTGFVLAFEAGTDDADFDDSGFVDTDDFTAFVLAFEAGC